MVFSRIGFPHKSLCQLCDCCARFNIGFICFSIRILLRFLLTEYKDLLGKFGQVHDVVFCGGQNVVHLTNNPMYQSRTSALVYKTCF